MGWRDHTGPPLEVKYNRPTVGRKQKSGSARRRRRFPANSVARATAARFSINNLHVSCSQNRYPLLRNTD
jgi:hypothetical protein